MVDFHGARARLDRAAVDLNALVAEIGIWSDADPQPHGNRISIEDGTRLTIYGVVRKHPPLGWGLAVGDIVNDLRSALDYMAYDLAIIKDGQDPPPNPSGIEFPIYLCRDRYGKVGKTGQRTGPGVSKATRMSLAAEAFVESIQPYQNGNAGNWLWILHELCIINKHRVIHLTPVLVEKVSLENMGGSNIDGLRLSEISFPNNRMEDGAVIATARLAGVEVGAEVNMCVGTHTYIAIDYRTDVRLAIDTLLRALIESTEWVYRELQTRTT